MHRCATCCARHVRWRGWPNAPGPAGSTNCSWRASCARCSIFRCGPRRCSWERPNARIGPGPLRSSSRDRPGRFSHIAGRRFFAHRQSNVTYRGVQTFRAMLEEVRSGTADFAMLPVENTTSGSVHDAYDALSHTDLAIIGEEVLRIEMCLISIADVPLEELRRVYSHPQALSQCTAFLASLPQRHRRDVRRYGDERRAHQGGERPDACGHCERRGCCAARPPRAASRYREPPRELHAVSRHRPRA